MPDDNAHEPLDKREDLTRPKIAKGTERTDLIVSRNDFDNVRQDASDARQDDTDEHLKHLDDVAAANTAAIDFNAKQTGPAGSAGGRGERGKTGDAGTKGDAGQRGQRGDEGVRGDAGAQGEPGTYVVGRLVLDTLTRLESKVDGTNTRMDGLTTRMDTLRDGQAELVATTNHRLDDFRDAMTDKDRYTSAALLVMETRISKKANKDELLTSLGERVMNKSYIRWLVGAGFAALIGTATVQHWWTWILYR